MEKTDRLLRQREVMGILGISASTLEQYRLKGRGPKFVKIGKAVRYRESDIQAYIAGLAAHGSTTAP